MQQLEFSDILKELKSWLIFLF